MESQDKTRQELEELAHQFRLPEAIADEVLEKVLDWVGQKLDEHPNGYLVRFNDVEQMNELARFAGLPQCEHARAFLAIGCFPTSALPDPDVLVVGIKRAA